MFDFLKKSFYITFGVFCLFLRFYSFIHEKHTRRDRQRDRQREKQASCRKPNVGLDPRTLGSHPESKADTQPLSHPGAPHHPLPNDMRHELCHTSRCHKCMGLFCGSTSIPLVLLLANST